MNNKFIEALNNGSEIVIISADTNDNSAIFWKTEGRYYTFSKPLGKMERGADYTDESFVNHLQKMQKEAAIIFIRGYEES